MKLLLAVFLNFLFLNDVTAADPTVDVNIPTSNGTATIRGMGISEVNVLFQFGNKNFRREVQRKFLGYKHPYGTSFRGIRYAQPPLASLRFTEAQRLDPSGLVQALGYGKPCVQGDGSSSSEDCLFINVFTPNVRLIALIWQPLLFRMPLNHPNSQCMSISTEVALLREVETWELASTRIWWIRETLSWFLWITEWDHSVCNSFTFHCYCALGFFSTRDAMARGNWAVSDWIEALNWVQRWIVYFGGDPTRVTIGGQSSGAEAVSTITLTPLAKCTVDQSSSHSFEFQHSTNSQFMSLEVLSALLLCHIQRKPEIPVDNCQLS